MYSPTPSPVPKSKLMLSSAGAIRFVYTGKGPVDPAATAVEFAPSVVEVPRDAFRDHANLERVTFHDGLRTIGPGAFRNCPRLAAARCPPSLVEVGDGAFSHCRGLARLEMNEGLRRLGAGALADCPRLARADCPSSLRTIGDGAFMDCEGLRGAGLNEGLADVGAGAFYGCCALEALELPSSLREIERQVFGACRKLRRVAFNDGLRRIGGQAFCHCVSLEGVVLPSTLAAIGDDAFEGCAALGEAVLNEGLQKIGDRAFSECSSLTQISLPSTLQGLGDSAFGECECLKTVNLQGGNHSIVRKNAFLGCGSLFFIELPYILMRLAILSDDDRAAVLKKMGELFGTALYMEDKSINLRTDAFFAHEKRCRRGLAQILHMIGYYELKDITTTIELAFRKVNLKDLCEGGDITGQSCSIEVPGPVRDNIMQFSPHGNARKKRHARQLRHAK